jgi:hypothetical protein
MIRRAVTLLSLRFCCVVASLEKRLALSDQIVGLIHSGMSLIFVTGVFALWLR